MRTPRTKGVFQRRLSTGVSIVVVDDQTLYLSRPRHDIAKICLLAPEAHAVADLLSGGWTADTLAALATRIGDEALAKWIDALPQFGFAAPDDGALEILLAAHPRHDRVLRHLSLFTNDAKATRRAFDAIRTARVLLIGVGTLGCWILQHLAISGLGGFVLVDGDRVADSNLSRQAIFQLRDVGRHKVDVCLDWLVTRDACHSVQIDRTFIGDLTEAESLLREHTPDMVILTADEPSWRLALWVQTACRSCRIAFIRGNAVGAGPFTDADSRGGCLECEFKALEDRFGLSRDVLEAGRHYRKAISPVISPAPSVTAAIIAQDVLHALSGVARPETDGRRITIDPHRSWNTSIRAIPRHPDCPAGHSTEL
jgi:adenylyltransferase/sulfurtransferase